MTFHELPLDMNHSVGQLSSCIVWKLEQTDFLYHLSKGIKTFSIQRIVKSVYYSKADKALNARQKKIDRTSVKLMLHLRKLTKLTKWKSDKN